MERNENDLAFLEECFKEFGNFFLVTIRTNEQEAREGLNKLRQKTASDYAKALAFLSLIEEATPYMRTLLMDLISLDPNGGELLGLLENIKNQFKIERLIRGE